MQKLKIFSDRAFLPKGIDPVPMLYPFWGVPPEPPDAPNSGRFDTYARTGSSIFDMTPLGDADLAVLPMDWSSTIDSERAVRAARDFIEAAARAGKWTLVFFWNDLDWEVPFPNVVVVRCTTYRSSIKPNEFPMPDFSEDLAGKYMDGKFPIRSKASKPIVGFDGFAASPSYPVIGMTKSLFRWVAGAAGLRRKPRRPPLALPGHVTRARALRALAHHPSVECRFVLRSGFLGGAVRPDGTFDVVKHRFARLELVRNMVDSDYVLCTRGAGSYSYRLYEALSCGRIPIILNAEAVLPFDFILDWKRYSVWVDGRDLENIGDRVAEFHARLSNDDFLALQASCRKLWEEWLSPQGFFANLHRIWSHCGGGHAG